MRDSSQLPSNTINFDTKFDEAESTVSSMCEEIEESGHPIFILQNISEGNVPFECPLCLEPQFIQRQHLWL